MKSAEELNRLVDQSVNGNRNALELLLMEIQNPVYKMALKMLWCPADAEDATQEILIKVLTHLGSFRKESSFKNWVFRIAANHLTTNRKRMSEETTINKKSYFQKLEEGPDSSCLKETFSSEELLLIEEIKLSCLHGLLIFLDRNLRIAFVLGEIFQVSGEEGAIILEISEAAYRKRLERARKKIGNFLTTTCGLVNPGNPCRCENMMDFAVETQWIDPDNLFFINHPCKEKKCKEQVENLHEFTELGRIASLYRNQPEFIAPSSFTESVKALVESGRYELL